MNTLLKGFTTRLRPFALRGTRAPLRAAFASLCCAALLAGCSKDLDEAPSVPVLPEPPRTEQGELSMSISIAGVASSAPGTYALTPQDEGFVDMDKFNVLLFSSADKDAADKDYRFVQFAPATERTDGAGNQNTTGHIVRHFTIELPTTGYENHFFKAMVIANHSPEKKDQQQTTADAWAELLKNRSLADARTAIVFEQPNGQPWNTGAGHTPLPLWGETASPFNAQMIRVSSIQMLRAVARIDVGVNLGGKVTDDKGDFTGKYDLTDLTKYNGKAEDRDGVPFELVSVALYNSASTGRLAPDPANMAPNRDGVTAPTLPTPFAGHDAPVAYPYNAGAAAAATNMLRGEIYLPETGNKGIDENSAAFYIVVGGKWNGGATTYYRVDFYNRAAPVGPDGKPVGGTEEGYVKPSGANRYDILRNHAYVINILRVRGEGYPTAATAAQSEPINMEVDILTWDTSDDMSNVVTDGQYKLMVSDTRLQYHADGTAQDLEVFTDFLLAGNPAESGWKLWMDANQTAGTGNYDHTQDVQVWAEQKDGTWKEVQKTDKNGRWYWTSGIANATGKLRAGFARFTVDHASGLMERTVRLTFTAGRMSQNVELVQDVKNTRTLSLLQQKLFFPKYPKKNQSAILKSSPTGATYYAVWTDKDGNTYRANISDPAADPVQGRDGDLGGIQKVLEQKNEDMLPTGFFNHQNHAPSESCDKIEFFEKADGTNNMFSLRPSDWDITHNDKGTEPTVPRTWRFEIEAYWDTHADPDDLTSEVTAADKNPERVKLEVEQSPYDVKWEVVRDALANTAAVDNEITVAWNASARPEIETVPADMPWYFLSKTDEGNLSGKEWVLNWPAMQYADVNGGSYQGKAGENVTFDVKLSPNESLYPRSVTFQASSPYDGFDRGTAKLKITQQGGPLILKLEPDVNVPNLPLTGNTYTLDYSTLTARTLKALKVRANTDWWWEWRKDKPYSGEAVNPDDPDNGRTELGDATQEAELDNADSYLAKYGTPINLHHSHPYWKNNTDGSIDKTIFGYIISDWLPYPSAILGDAPGKENATKENGDTKSLERVWEQALVMRSVEGVYIAPNAVSDDAATARKVPVAGQYYSEIQLYNEHDIMYDAADADHTGPMQGDWGTDVAAASKILRIQRTVPSFTFIAERPFGGNNHVNLSNLTVEELGKDGTDVKEDDPRLWKNQRLTIRSNNEVRVTLRYKNNTDTKDWTDIHTLTERPTNKAGYSEILSMTLGELGELTDGQRQFIEDKNVNYTTAKGVHYYQIVISGKRQSAKDGADEDFTEVLEYSSGYWMVHPATPQITRGGKYTHQGFTLLFDFSASSYPQDQKVRIYRRPVSVGDFNGTTLVGNGVVGGEEYTEYVLNGRENKCYIKHQVPENDTQTQMYIYWVEYEPTDDKNNWLTMWDDGQGPEGEKDKYLFLQDAQQFGGYVFLKSGPALSAITDNKQIVKKIVNTGKMSQNKAVIYLYNQYVPGYDLYKKNYTDSFTGAEFVTTSAANEKAADFNTQTVASNSQSARGKEGCVFLGLYVKATGHHDCVGSVWHTRTVSQTLVYQPEFYNMCPDGHGIIREWMQEWNSINDTYYVTVNGAKKNQMELIIVRNGFYGVAGGMPYVNESQVAGNN